MFRNKEDKRTSISELGEFGFIKHISKNFKNLNQSTLLGIGDDAAIIDPTSNKILVSTDLLIEKVHFDLAYTPLKHLGYKTAIVNFSDIVAMNATPTQLLISIAISNRFSLEAIEELYEGIELACKKYKVDLIGGDTSSSISGLFISATVIGQAKMKNIVLRNTANEGDLICVSGDLGAAYAGLLLLQRENEVFKSNPEVQPELNGVDYVLERQLKPEARLDIISLFEKNHILPSAMIDISDGLSSEIMHICTNSKVGCNIYEHKIPIDPLTISIAGEFNFIPSIFALNGGEDYELLFTIKQSDFEKIKNLKQISIIGHITAQSNGLNLISSGGTSVPLQAQGWNSFK